MSSSSPRIAIIGGGIAALTLARILQLKNIPCTVFERDSSPSDRIRGGTLDLHTHSGQQALKIAELHDEFRKYMRLEGQETKIANKKGELMFDHFPEEGDESRPEIDRGQLRQIFLDVLGDTVKWGSHVKSVVKLQSGGYTLHFENDSSQDFDLVVGADGAFSKTRSLLTSARPGYTGITFIEMYLENVENDHPVEAATVGQGTIYSADDGKGIFAQRNSGSKIRVYAVLPVPEFWSKQVEKEYEWSDPNGPARKKLLETYYSDWSPKLRNLIEKSKSTIRPYPLYYLPIELRWTHLPGVTLIGDAAHVMSPYAGEGANLAMLDGAKLGEAIAEGLAKGGKDDLDESIRNFEEWMFGNAAPAAFESDKNLRMFNSMGAAERIAGLFTQFMKQRGPDGKQTDQAGEKK